MHKIYNFVLKIYFDLAGSNRIVVSNKIKIRKEVPQMKKLISLLVALALLCGCTAALADTRLIIGSGPIGGAFYPIAGGIAQIINDYVDGVTVNVQVTAGGIENTRLVGQGELDLGLSSSQQCYDAYTNTGIFEGENLQLNVLGTLHSTVCQIVVLADSDIVDATDLKGKKVAIGEAGGGAEQQFKEMVNALGWTENDVNMVYLPYDQAMDQLGDGLIDAGCVYSGTPAASITNLASRKDVRLVNIPEDIQTLWTESVDPFLSVFEVIPAGTYSGMDEDIYTAVQRIQLSVSPAMSEDMAYEITKALYEHLDLLSTFHASAATITREAAANTVGAAQHPGAEKYFKEAGLE